MSLEVTYNPSDPTVPNVVISSTEVDVPTGNPNTINNPNTSQVNGNIIPFSTKVSGNAVVPFTGQDSTNWAAAIASATNLSERSSAQSDILSPGDLGKLERAAVDQLLTQLNAHTTFETSLLAAIAAAASLPNLQTRCAALTTPSQITLAQAKTAISNEIGSGGEGD